MTEVQFDPISPIYQSLETYENVFEVIRNKKIESKIKRFKSKINDISPSLKDDYDFDINLDSIGRCFSRGYQSESNYVGFHKDNLDNPLFIDPIKQSCNNRFCPYCSEKLRQKKLKRIVKIIKQYKTPRFLTLSFRNTNKLNKDYLKECATVGNRFIKELKSNRSWHKDLRQQKCLDKKITNKEYWESDIYINNYVSVLEVSFNPKGSNQINRDTKEIIGVYDADNWNVHYHYIMDSSFIDVYLAREIFKKISKDNSFYVYINANATKRNNNLVINSYSASNYISKYLSKVESSIFHDYTTLKDYYYSTDKIHFLKISGIKETDEIEKKFKYYNLKYSGTNIFNEDYISINYYDLYISLMFEYGLSRFYLYGSLDNSLEVNQYNLYQEQLKKMEV
jgi:hypothetical protein